VGAGFPKRSCSNKKIERDDDSKKSRAALSIAAVAAAAMSLALKPGNFGGLEFFLRCLQADALSA